MLSSTAFLKRNLFWVARFAPLVSINLIGVTLFLLSLFLFWEENAAIAVSLSPFVIRWLR